MTNLFEKLASLEREFTDQLFLSPTLRGNKVRVRIQGIVLSLEVTKPRSFEGWGIFKPVSYQCAELVREPTLVEKAAYFKLFPVVRLVVSHRCCKTWIGVPAQPGDRSLPTKNAVPVRLMGSCERFDTILTRFDGTHCWFEKRDPRRSPRIAKQLRECWNKGTHPAQVSVPESSSVERKVYERAYQHQIGGFDRQWRALDPQERQIRSALKRGGAEYQSHREIEEAFVVEYVVNGQVHRSSVDKNSLAVQSAGICLDGFDRDFDLQSLVGVIAEGQRTGEL